MDRQLYTAVALIKSTQSEPGGYFGNTYQICLADAEEGNIKVPPGDRRDAAIDVNADNVITAILTFNDEWVDYGDNPPEQIYYPFSDESGYNTIEQLIEGESYKVYVPRYGCVVTRFMTKKRI